MYNALSRRTRMTPTSFEAVDLLALPIGWSTLTAHRKWSLFVTATALALAGCGEQGSGEPSPTEKTNPSFVHPDSHSRENASADEEFPANSSSKDRALMSQWVEENDLCRGSSDPATIKSMCARRERTEVELGRRDWCFAYEDWTASPVDYRWHSCAEKTLPRNQRTQHRDESAFVNSEARPADSQNIDRRHQAVEDARAAVRESWEHSGKTIETIVIGYKCDVIDQFSANLAVQKIQSRMQDELLQAGVIPDASSTAEIERITADSVDNGKAAAQKGECDRMTPASRGRLRALLGALI